MQRGNCNQLRDGSARILDLFLLAIITALSGVGRFVAVEVQLAFGILSKIYRQILVSFFKNGIVGCSRERHADLGLMPQIRTLRPHDTHRVQLASFQMLDGCGRCAGQILLRNVKNSAAQKGQALKVKPIRLFP
jgi:hypothetical protein